MKLGRYTLNEVIGEGGYGQVWRATLSGEMGFTKTVAIKVLHPDVARSADQIDSLVNEALIGSRLQHPNIVEVHEFTRIDDRYVMVMEMVEGETLRDMMARHPDGLEPERARRIFTQVARGLAFAHDLKNDEGTALGLVHRDLKPANVMITKDGIVKICDFGIAISSLSNRHTTEGVMKGSPNYMSPEQVRGLPITGDTDLWALGAIGFEMLTGRRLVAGSDLRSLVLQIPALVPEAAMAEVESKETELAKVIGACLQQEGTQRPRAADVLSILETGSSDAITIDNMAVSADVRATSAFSYDQVNPEGTAQPPPPTTTHRRPQSPGRPALNLGASYRSLFRPMVVVAFLVIMFMSALLMTFSLDNDDAHLSGMPATVNDMVLRVGIIQDRRVVHERLFEPGQSVTIGESSENTFVFPTQDLPKQFTLFEAKAGKYFLNTTPSMTGQLAEQEEVTSLEQIRKRGSNKGDINSVAIGEESRGKLMIGAITVMFQFVPVPTESAQMASRQSRHGGTLRIGIPSRMNDRFNIFMNISDLSQVLLTGLVLETLLVRENGETVPHTLKRFDLSEDGRTITLELRDDLRFHPHPCLSTTETTPVTAEDLKFSIEALASQGDLQLPLASGADNAGVSIAGERTVTLHLAEPTVYASQALTSVVLLPAAIEGCDDPDAMKQPVSTGPFRFGSISETGKAEVVRFDEYWKTDESGSSLPYLDRVQFIPYSSINDVLSQVRQDKLHLVWTTRNELIPYVTDPNVPRPRFQEAYAHDRVRIGVPWVDLRQVVPFLALFYIEKKNSPFSNREFRKAVALALDRKTLSTAYGGMTPQARFLQQGNLGFDPSVEGYEYNVEAAKAALGAAGHPNGQGLKKLVVVTLEGFNETAKAAVQNLNDVGIPARLEFVGHDQLREVWASGAIDVAIGSVRISLHSDEVVGFAQMESILKTGKEVRDLMVQIPQTMERTERGALYTQLEIAMLKDVAPFIPIGSTNTNFHASIILFSASIENAFDPITGSAIVSNEFIYLEPQSQAP